MENAHFTAIADVLTEADNRRRHAALAECVVQYGQPFVETLAFLSQNAEALDLGAQGAVRLSALLNEASDLHSDWLSGKRVSARADERERRVVELTSLATAAPDDPLLARLAADAIMRLPIDDELRDEAFARRTLLGCLERARGPQGSLDDVLVAAFYLLHHRLIGPAEAVPLIEEVLASLQGATPDARARGDFLEGAHGYCLLAATENWKARGESFRRWRALGARVLAVAGTSGADAGVRVARMKAMQLDIAEDEAGAADAYREVVAAGDPSDTRVQAAALSEATLRLQLGQCQRIVELLDPLLAVLTERYLTAVAAKDVDDAGFAHGRAVSALCSALFHLGQDRRAIEVVDASKSLRLRYRGALGRHPAHAEVLALERSLLAVDRAGGTESPVVAGGVGLSLRTRLLEQYRRIRPDLWATVGRIRSVEEIASALDVDEGAVILATCDDTTLVALVSAGGRLSVRPLDDHAWEDWDAVFSQTGGWLDLLAGRPDADGSSALAGLLEACQPLGAVIEDLAAAAGVQRLAVIPHRWLHLVPYWALADLEHLPIAMYASVDELVTSRGPRGAAPSGRAVVVKNPTGDLVGSGMEVESVAQIYPGAVTVLGPGEATAATATSIDAALDHAALFHFSGHAFSDHRSPGRSALLVAATPELTEDPFPGWASAVDQWEQAPDGWRRAHLPGIGRLTERMDADTGRLQRQLERGNRPSLFADYRQGALRRLGELWTAEDIMTSGQAASCRLGFLSACESGLAGGGSASVDEYGGLPAALHLGGIDVVACSLWPVDEGFACVYVDLFYRYLGTADGDAAMAAEEARTWLRHSSKDQALDHLARMADRVRRQDPIAAIFVEAYRNQIEERGASPWADPWEWASFHVRGRRPACVALAGEGGADVR